MYEWDVAINNSHSVTVWADTFMEAELEARIRFGVDVRLSIKLIEVHETREDEQYDEEVA